ncbi:MAG: hypothetical protein IJS30_05200 [Bacteroidales bacterium]|nr:hypothetical protein [Bacteroidales bacterium]
MKHFRTVLFVVILFSFSTFSLLAANPKKSSQDSGTRGGTPRTTTVELVFNYAQSASYYGRQFGIDLTDIEDLDWLVMMYYFGINTDDDYNETRTQHQEKPDQQRQ